MLNFHSFLLYLLAMKVVQLHMSPAPHLPLSIYPHVNALKLAEFHDIFTVHERFN